MYGRYQASPTRPEWQFIEHRGVGQWARATLDSHGPLASTNRNYLLGALTEDERKMAILQRQTYDLAKEMAKKKFALAPIRKVPDEILCSIFLATGPLAYPEGKGGMRILLNVCRRWRLLIFSSPELWSHFNASVISSPPPALEPTRRWLDRAKRAPLTMDLSMDCVGHVFDYLMTELAHRIGSVDAAAIKYSHGEWFPGPQTGTAIKRFWNFMTALSGSSTLTKLNIEPIFKPHDIPRLPGDKVVLPCLKILGIRNYSSRINIEAPNLKTLFIYDSKDRHDWLEDLPMKFPSITRFELGSSAGGDPNHPDAPIVFPHLRSLDAGIYSARIMKGSPGVEEVRLGVGALSGLRGQYPNLHRLRYSVEFAEGRAKGPDNFTIQAFRAALGCFPSLQHAVMDITQSLPYEGKFIPFIQAFTEHADGSLPCLQLRLLEISKNERVSLTFAARAQLENVMRAFYDIRLDPVIPGTADYSPEPRCSVQYVIRRGGGPIVQPLEWSPLYRYEDGFEKQCKALEQWVRA